MFQDTSHLTPSHKLTDPLRTKIKHSQNPPPGRPLQIMKTLLQILTPATLTADLNNLSPIRPEATASHPLDDDMKSTASTDKDSKADTDSEIEEDEENHLLFDAPEDNTKNASTKRSLNASSESNKSTAAERKKTKAKQ